MLGIRTTISVILSQTGQQSEAVTDDEPQQLRKPKSTRQQLLANDLPVRTTFVSKTDEHSEHGHELKLVGTHFVREVVHRIPGRLFVEKIYEKTYKCSTCELEDGSW
jgi:hypothetical protein